MSSTPRPIPPGVLSLRQLLRRLVMFGLVIPVMVFASLLVYSMTGDRRVYLIPIEADPELMQSLQKYYRTELGLDVRVLPLIQLSSAAWDDYREQLVAERVIDLMYRSYWGLRWPTRTIAIGITSTDMYIEKSPWEFAFSYREGGRSAVVSYARMDPELYGYKRDNWLRETRLRKMVTRNIGFMRYRLRKTSNRDHLMYQDILGLEELDRVSEDLRAAGFPIASRPGGR